MYKDPITSVTPLEDGEILPFLLRRMYHADHWTVSGVWLWGLWATVDEVAVGGSQSRDLEQGSEETLVLWGHVGPGRAPSHCSSDET